jgi:hypothetical protein
MWTLRLFKGISQFRNEVYSSALDFMKREILDDSFEKYSTSDDDASNIDDSDIRLRQNSDYYGILMEDQHIS